MALFQGLIDQAIQLNRIPQHSPLNLPFHPSNNIYKTVYFGLKIPHLDIPLHYLNFSCLMGQPHAPAFYQEHHLEKSIANTVSVHSSVSGHMIGAHHLYALDTQCEILNHTINLNQKERIIGKLPHIEIYREDEELSYQLKINTSEAVSYFNKLHLNMAEHWSVLCRVTGDVQYKKQNFNINQLGALEYARTLNFPYIAHAFYSYVLINLDETQQLLCIQTRNASNEIIYSYAFIRDEKTKSTLFFEQTDFIIHRVYPQIKTAHGHSMYLAREFEWHCLTIDHKNQLKISGECRGDYKFGVGEGFAGSFNYQITLNGNEYFGENGYLEYIDCRALKWQEQNEQENKLEKNYKTASVLLKKP